MKFANSIWLWALLILPLIFAFLTMDEKRRKKQFSHFADSKVWNRIAPELDFTLRFKKIKLLVLAFGFLILALARPQFGTHEETIQVSGLDILVALDVSNSMLVEDVVPSRLQKAKHMIRSILGQLEGDRVGAVAFALSSYVACPLTTDLDYLSDTIQILSPKTIQNQGTDIGMALETSMKALERGAQEVGSGVEQPGTQASKVILLLSDGEEHEDQALRVAAQLRSKGIKLYAIGIGTEKGGPIPVRDNNQNQGFRRDRSGQPILSKFDSNFLQKLASEAGGRYWSASESENEIIEFLQDVGALNRGDYAERRFLVYEDRYQIPLFIAILILLLEISIPARKLKLGTSLFVLTVLLLTESPSAYATDFLKRPATLDTYLNNEKGLENYQKGNLEEAQQNFGAAQARDPSQHELEFNQGVVEFQRGEVDRAIESFKGASRGALEKKNSELLSKSLYNLGNAYAKKGQSREAVQSYSTAIQAAIQSKNPDLEKQARKNLQLLAKEQNKQKQENQQKDKKKDDPKDDKEKKKSDSEKNQDPSKQDQKQSEEKSKENSKENSKNQESKNGDKKESPRYQDSKKEKFQSKKMDRQDAERVLSELKNRERELQEKLNTQNGRSQNHAKDW